MEDIRKKANDDELNKAEKSIEKTPRCYIPVFDKFKKDDDDESKENKKAEEENC